MFNVSKMNCLLVLTETIFLVLVHQNCTEAIDLNFFQNDYNINFERAETVNFNKDYLTHMNLKTFKFNRTCAAFNMSYAYKKSEILLRSLRVTDQGYRFASNEYRFFPIRFEMNMCDIYNMNMAGIGNCKCRNYIDCPVETGKEYYVCNFTPDESKLPPSIPNGRYKLHLQALYHSAEVWVIQLYGEVTRSILRG